MEPPPAKASTPPGPSVFMFGIGSGFGIPNISKYQMGFAQVLIAHELVEMGVSKEEFVLGFHSPYRRQITEFAVG